ncbi:hypothetical protein F5884DRAFT_759217 [Xylogone sp. PMI_703]|nr:hypothetical protein F5884DRAFT_759217 [Xylogone sp. PMI_703]
MQESRVPRVPQNGYRGRVRSGCLTCRSRKVKCDEMRPVCNNCIRVKRSCVYKPKKTQQSSTIVTSPEESSPSESVHGSRGTGSISDTYPSPAVFDQENSVISETAVLDDTLDTPWLAVQDSFLSPDPAIVDVTVRLENVLRRQNGMSIAGDDAEFETTSPSTLISRDIKLTTTMDILTAREVPLQQWFSFFIEGVDFPVITSYDGVNWRQMKFEVAELGMSNAAVASAIIALSALFKGQLYGLPLCKALSLYYASKSAYEKSLSDTTHDFGATLVAAFLLCLFEFIHYEAVPILREPSDVFLKRLSTWVHYESRSELHSRLMVWFRLLHMITIRGGGMGLISESIYDLLPSCNTAIPNLKQPSNHPRDASADLYQMLGTPIFEFYFQLQMISGEIAKLTHYHRSRATGVDQEEVVQKISQVKSRLRNLWDGRSATQRQTPEDLRSHLAPPIANPIISLVGICTAAFHAEFVEMDRVLGDPVSESADSKEAMRRIREIVDGDYNVYEGGKLNPGYLRPLFQYSIECMDREENQWAVERLQRIRNPICRSDFFAAFGKALSDAQLRKERRVTSKYFCIWYFGVPPPFM